MLCIIHPLFASPAENIGQLVIGILAVAGAFLIGHVLTWLFFGGIARFLFKRSMPLGVMKFLRLLGGAALAILVATFVFGAGGMGWGPGNAHKGDIGVGDQKKDQEEAKKEVVRPKIEDIQPKDDDGLGVSVTILGGDASEGRYYLLEEDVTPRTFTEITYGIQEVKKNSAKPLNRVKILVYKDSSARDSAVVKNLEKWATDERFGVEFPAVQNQSRPVQ